MESRTPLLVVEELSLEFRTRTGVIKALENVSFEATTTGNAGT